MTMSFNNIPCGYVTFSFKLKAVLLNLCIIHILDIFNWLYRFCFLLQVLSELLQETAFRGIRRKYVSYHDNLKFAMNTLKSDSGDIQFEAFHIFKVSSKQKAARYISCFPENFKPNVKVKEHFN